MVEKTPNPYFQFFPVSSTRKIHIIHTYFIHFERQMSPNGCIREGNRPFRGNSKDLPADCKSVGFTFDGSNPSPATIAKDPSR
jgi:hypothetical protein